jgi:phosphoglycerate kinase
VQGLTTALVGVPLLEDLGELDGRRVLLRADLNVPLGTGPGGRVVVADDFRLRAALPTITWLRERGASVTCCSHLGRPSGPDDRRFSMAPVREALQALSPGTEVLENLRFDPGEVTNDPGFVDRLVEDFDAYVNDAFGVAHRAHASVVGPPSRLPSAAGRCLAFEVEVLGELLERPPRPFVAVLGGSKVADKLGVVASICEVADAVLLGGAMAFSFLKAQGRRVGASLVDDEQVAACGALLEATKKLELPTDLVALSPGAAFGVGCTNGDVETFDDDLPDGWCGLDVGEETSIHYGKELAGAATILWNGPMGAFEDERFSAGTRAIARATADSDAYSVVGGGDSVRALAELDLLDRISFVSTGGGATLEFLEFGDLPALVALRGAPNARRGS